MWQRWVDAQGAERLAQTLVSGGPLPNLTLIAHPVPFPALTPGHAVSPSLVFEPTKPETLGTGPGTCTVSTSLTTSPCHTPFPPAPGLLAWSRGNGPLFPQGCRWEEAAEGLGAAGDSGGPTQGLLATVPTAQAVAPEMGLATVAVARPAVAGGSAVPESGGRPGPFPGTGGGPISSRPFPTGPHLSIPELCPPWRLSPEPLRFQGGVNSVRRKQPGFLNSALDQGLRPVLHHWLRTRLGPGHSCCSHQPVMAVGC